VAVGVQPLEPWSSAEAIAAKAMPRLGSILRPTAARILSDYGALGPDPYASVYGFYDGHGWNMAFDHQTRRLNGIYDFADSGIGPLHQEFIYSNFISPDLTARIVAAYESATGLALDRKRIETLTGAHRLWELAVLSDNRQVGGGLVENFGLWCRMLEG
jgi:Phosphotransferase enzyme family